MIKFIVGVTIGIVGTLSIGLMLDESSTESRKCMTQQVHLINSTASAFIIVGEAVICAKDWQISNIYGPDAETFYGRIKLRDWDSEEFFIEEESEENDTRREND